MKIELNTRELTLLLGSLHYASKIAARNASELKALCDRLSKEAGIPNGRINVESLLS